MEGGFQAAHGPGGRLLILNERLLLSAVGFVHLGLATTPVVPSAPHPAPPPT